MGNIYSKHRETIKSVIENSDRHLSAEEIIEECKKQGHSISQATVYRNLNILIEQGEICKVSFPEGPDRYDKKVSLHSHLFCRVCNSVCDTHKNDLLEVLQNELDEQILSYNLCMEYICPKCRAS